MNAKAETKELRSKSVRQGHGHKGDWRPLSKSLRHTEDQEVGPRVNKAKTLKKTGSARGARTRDTVLGDGGAPRD